MGRRKGKTGAEQRADVINEVSVSEETEAPKAKAKAKRAPRKQLVVAESLPEGSVEVTATLDEVQAVVSISTEEESSPEA